MKTFELRTTGCGNIYFVVMHICQNLCAKENNVKQLYC